MDTTSSQTTAVHQKSSATTAQQDANIERIEAATTPIINQQQNYKVKCNLLEYHIQEAVLVNKALRSELKQYRDKIDFEKRLRNFLINRVKGFSGE